jgi:hypothetical protein
VPSSGENERLRVRIRDARKTAIGGLISTGPHAGASTRAHDDASKVTVTLTFLSALARSLRQTLLSERPGMSSNHVLDFLTEELIVGKNIVRPLTESLARAQLTYMLLSFPLPGYVSFPEQCPWYPRKPGQKVRSTSTSSFRARNDLFSGSLPTTTPSTRALWTLLTRPISSEESRVSRT